MAFTYLIVDCFSIAFLLILFINTHDKSEKLLETRCFRMIVIMTIVALASDMIAWQFEGKSGDLQQCILWITNISCYLLSGAMSFSWLCYSALKMNRVSRITRVKWALIALPVILLAIVTISSPWTHWMFSINSANTYQRGPFFIMQMAVPFGYMVVSALWAVYRASRERLRQQKLEYLYLGLFIVFPTIGGALQLLFYGLSLAWPCSALALMLVYVTMQNHKISLDALTGLNNRGRFDKHLYNCIERAENELPFALFMLDVDNFKKINDKFGHIAGDAALIDVASILKAALTGTKSFLARYGGDEFAIILYFSSKKEIDELVARILAESEKCNKNNADSYQIVLSLGYVCYDQHRYYNYHDMLTAADARMYKQKQEHKQKLSKSKD